MTRHTFSRRLSGHAGRLLIGTFLLAAGSGLALASNTTPQSDSVTLRTQATHFWEALSLEQRNAWSQLRANFQWQDATPNARVQAWIDHYRASPQNVIEITRRARPWLAWIINRVEARDLPGEVALIPFIESSFDPTARSHRGAAGLWQFMPGTADALGLPRNRAYDGRLDVASATETALDYIELQAEQWYDGDIALSLAAYNAGAGTVNRARRAAVARGRGDDYWSLRLPRETMHYLPKLQAIAAIVAEPERYGIELPPIDTSPAVTEVPLERPLALTDAARLAGVSTDVMAELNPGVLNGLASPAYMPALLVPAGRETRLMARLDQAPVRDRYVVRRGDNLSLIASRHGVSVTELRRHNGLSGDLIHAGQVLQIPAVETSLASR